MAIKPCAKCHHTGATFTGVRMITKWCPCDGYLDRAGRTADGGETHA